MKVEYLDNNGYLIETDKAIYVFDFVEGLLSASYLRKQKPMLFFVSNQSPEHYSMGIDVYRKTIVYSYDIPQEPLSKVFKMYPKDMLHLGFAKVYAEDTTRDGVSYIIKEEDKTFIIAGNLNNWHYQEFSSDKRVELETERFLACIQELKCYENPDVLIFPVNPELGFNYAHGAKKAVRSLKPKHFFPTQFKRLRNIEEFIKWSETSDTRFHFPKYNNENFEVNV